MYRFAQKDPRAISVQLAFVRNFDLMYTLWVKPESYAVMDHLRYGFHSTVE